MIFLNLRFCREEAEVFDAGSKIICPHYPYKNILQNQKFRDTIISSELLKKENPHELS